MSLHLTLSVWTPELGIWEVAEGDFPREAYPDLHLITGQLVMEGWSELVCLESAKALAGMAKITHRFHGIIPVNPDEGYVVRATIA